MGVRPCNIQQGESKQASRAFVTPTTLNVAHDFAPSPLPFLFSPSVHYFSIAVCHSASLSPATFRAPFFFPSSFLQSRIIPQIASLFDHPESPVVLAPQPDALRSILVFVISFSRVPFESAIFLSPRIDIYITLNFSYTLASCLFPQYIKFNQSFLNS